MQDIIIKAVIEDSTWDFSAPRPQSSYNRLEELQAITKDLAAHGPDIAYFARWTVELRRAYLRAYKAYPYHKDMLPALAEGKPALRHNMTVAHVVRAYHQWIGAAPIAVICANCGTHFQTPYCYGDTPQVLADLWCTTCISN